MLQLDDMFAQHFYKSNKSVSLESLLSGKSLAPDLVIWADWEHGGHGMEPATSMSLPSEVVKALGELQLLIEETVQPVTAASAVSGRRFPKPQAAKLLEQEARRWLNNKPELKKYFKWNQRGVGSLDFHFRKGVLKTESKMAELKLKIQISRGVVSQTVTLPQNSIFDLVQILDYLRDNSRAIPQEALQNQSVVRFLHVLNSLKALRETEKKQKYLRPQVADAEISVTHMGHAYLIADSGPTRVLIDPVIFPGGRGLEKQPLTSAQLGRVDAIFFTHHHLDHMDTGSLLLLPHDVPVFVPRYSGGLHKPNYVPFLKAMGFKNVKELDHWQRVEFEDGFSVQALPFFGEARSHLEFDANCYLLSRNKKNILVLADSSPDSEGKSLLTGGILSRMIKNTGPIQMILGTWWQHQDFIYRLSPSVFMSPRIKSNQWLQTTENCCVTEAYLKKLLKTSKAQTFVTYAESARECFVPKNKMSPYVPAISFFWKSIKTLTATIRREINTQLIEAQPFMVFGLTKAGKTFVNKTQVASSRRKL